MILEVLGFEDHGHDVVQNNSASQMSSQTPLAAVMSTVDTGEYGGWRFDESISLFENIC